MLVKINAVNNNAVETLRSNLIREHVPFKQLGSAFLFGRFDSMLKPNIFKNLWSGANANIEDQELSDVDKSSELYLH